MPRELGANLAFRKRVMRAGSERPEVAAGLRAMCAQDPVFFASVFGWSYDPRLERDRERPIVLYPFQEALLCELIAA